ncbi:hypothetical protein [Ruegeria atlantica]|uniref:hypothetical protein n=1 Tax=Ruegeria atlantica TaxID=81569 RepID=UPI002495A780|nr:hypothetical protein [Ruegeria atlantica]
MTAALIALCFLGVVSFLATTTVAHLLFRGGFAWIVIVAIVVSAMSIAYLFPSGNDGPPEDADFLAVILTWSLVLPALAGAILGGLIGALKKMRDNH